MKTCKGQSLKTVAAVVVCVFYLLGLPTEANDAKVDMFQLDPGPRSVNSNMTVVSRLYENGSVDARFFISKRAEDTSTGIQVGTVTYDENDNVNSNFDPKDWDLSFRFGEIRTVFWDFTNLPLTFNGSFLITEMTPYSLGGTNYNHTLVEVRECHSSQSIMAWQQDSIILITAISSTNFSDKANCTCGAGNQVLFHANGTIAKGSATCGLHAEWEECKSLQCWSGPQNVSVIQLNKTLNATTPFNCSYTEGFPKASAKAFKIDNKIISESYTLKSYDHGKSVTCEVSSNFTKAISEISGSPAIKIIVHYPPENSTVSDTSPIINMNDTKLLTYYVYANPSSGGIDVTATGASEQASPIFSFICNYKDETQYICNFNATVITEEDYGSYNICASTLYPAGKDCANLVIRNASTPTISQTDATTFSVPTDAKAVEPAISATIIGVIIVGTILLVMIFVGVFVLCRRRMTSNMDSDKEVRDNELYGLAQNQTPSTGNPETIRQEKPNILYGSASGIASVDAVEYAMADPDAGDEGGVILDTSAAGPSCSYNTAVYAQINKKKGNVNDGYSSEIRDGKSETTAATYTVVDKSNKRKEGDVPEVYAVVNKPRTKG